MASFRDPAGSVFRIDGRIYRIIRSPFVAEFEQTQKSEAALRWVREGRLIRSTPASAPIDLAPGDVLVEHEPVWFPSYPHEWPSEMLAVGAEVTLDLAIDLLDEGLGLKDATPYNVLFRGSQPVFVDVLSLERRRPEDPTWLAYSQFIRTFLLPLLAEKHLGSRCDHVFLGSREGLDPAAVYQQLGALRALRPSLLGPVTMSVLLDKWAESGPGIYRPRTVDTERSRFILRSLFRRLRRQISSARPRRVRPTNWTGYKGVGAGAKREFIRDFMRSHRPRRVLDVGSNTGEFSMLAAKEGAGDVVSIDSDPACVGVLFRKAAESGLPIWPLVVDFARPTPAIGWRNAECRSFLDRTEGQFDAVFLLAIIHHLVISERTPLGAVLEMCGSLSRGFLLIEFVGAGDKQFQRLLRGRESLYLEWTEEYFADCCRKHFRVRGRLETDEHRRLYILEK